MPGNYVTHHVSRGLGQPLLMAVGRLIVFTGAAAVIARGSADPDLWGHLKFGLDIANTWQLSSVDPYSFTQDVRWINHEWLSELCFALAYRAGGTTGLFLLKTAILAVTFVLLARVSRSADRTHQWWLLALCIFGVATEAVTFRPQLWSLLGLAFLCDRLSSGTRLWLLPMVFAVWANLHGGWIVGAGFVLLWLVGRAIDSRDLSAQAPAAGIIGLSIGATLLNPYGWGLWEFLATTVRPGREVSEWRPLWEVAEIGPLWPLVIGIVIATLVARRHRLTWATVLPVVYFGIGGLLVARMAPLFCEVSVFALAPLFVGRTVRELSRPYPTVHTAVDVTVVAAIWIVGLVGGSRCLAIRGDWTPDLVAAGVLSAPSINGRLITSFNWGQYAIWHWGPRLRVSTDGRRETVYSEATLALQRSVAEGGTEGLKYLASVRPEYVWLPLPSSVKTAEWLTANGYRIDIKTERSFVASRLDLPALPPAAPLPACFP